MEKFLDTLQDYILVIKDSNINFCNKALRGLLGDNLKEVNGYDILKLIEDKHKSGGYINIKDKNNKELMLEPIIIEGAELIIVVLKELKNKLYDAGDLELILDNIPLCAWIKDTDCKYVYVNKKYADTLNLDKSEFIGKDDKYVWDIKQANICMSEDRRVIKEKGYLVITQRVEMNNDCIWFNIIKFAILDEYKEVKFVIGLAHDISEEISLKENEKVLEHEVQMETLKNEFFTNISHEFKTPLNVIITATKLIDTYIDNIKKQSLNYYKLKEHIASIKKNSYRLERLISNLIDISKIDSGDYKISMNNYNVISLVEDVSLSVVNYINSENISILFDTNEEEKIIRCDKDSIERIILNIISNSIKHIYGNGSILVNVNAQEDYVDISVKDNGEGISEEHMKKIFNRFEQGDKSLSRKNEGSGLGLFIVKSLVDMHNGDINIKSELGKGTEVIIRLYSNDLKSGEKVEGKVGSLINKCDKELSDIYYI